jgi:hypothetical protein
MSHDLFEVIRIDGVENIEEVLSLGSFVICILLLEVDGEFFITSKTFPEALDRQLIPVRHMYEVHLFLLE